MAAHVYQYRQYLIGRDSQCDFTQSSFWTAGHLVGICGELYSDERFTRLVLPICLEEKSGRAIGVSLIVFNSDLSIIDETMDIDDGLPSNGVVKNFVMVVTSINPINQA